MKSKTGEKSLMNKSFQSYNFLRTSAQKNYYANIWEMEISQEEGSTFTLHFLENYAEALSSGIANEAKVKKRKKEKKNASSYNHIILGY
jgi:hypothetical protein